MNKNELIEVDGCLYSQEALIEEAKKRYPIGTKYKCAVYKNICEIIDHNYNITMSIDKNYIFDANADGKISLVLSTNCGAVMFNGKWAKITSESKPEYYKYTSIDAFNTGFTKDRIYKCINPDDLEDTENFIDDDFNNNGFSGENYKHFIPSTKGAYEAQFKTNKQMSKLDEELEYRERVVKPYNKDVVNEKCESYKYEIIDVGKKHNTNVVLPTTINTTTAYKRLLITKRK